MQVRHLFSLVVTWMLGSSAAAFAAAPTAHTQEASWLGTTSARLYGAANPNGETGTAWFRISTTHPGSCNDAFGTRVPTNGGVALGSGTGHMVFSLDASGGLTSGTVYYYCAIAQNGSGKAYGVVHSFKQGGSPPSASTWSAKNLTATSVDIEGAAAGNGEATTGWHRYSATNPGVCDDAFGTRMPSSGGTSVGSSSSYVSWSQPLSGLTPGTTYYFCALAQNASGIDFGQLNAFTTPALAPIVTTSSASSVTASSAVLRGSANPQGGSTTGFFRYATTNPGTCSTSFGTRTPSSGDSSLGSGNTVVPYSQTLTGLQPGTTYYYCAQASNSGGTSVGAVSSFTTPSASPSVTTSNAGSISGTGATLYASVNPNGAATTAWFRHDTVAPSSCDDAFGTRAPVTGGSTIGDGTSAVSVNQPLSGLTLGTTYYFCAIAENANGLSFGQVLSFKMPDSPTVTTSNASSVTSNSATLWGSAIPNGASTNGYFVWGTTNPGTCDANFGTATSTSSLGSGSSNVSFNKALSNLSPGTTYYYCAAASNAAGVTFGGVFSFTTSAVKPTVITDLPAEVTASSVTFAGSANPGGGSTTALFRYSTTSPGSCNDTFGDPLPATGGINLGAGTSSVPFVETLSNAIPGTRYYYCAIAQNAVGTAFGSVRSVVIPEPPVVNTTVATPYPLDQAYLRGGANPKYGASTGWFRISSTDPGTCDDSFGTRVPATGGTAIPSGASEIAYSQFATGLVPETTYYYCAIASNVAGTSFGPVVSFRMPGKPIVTTQPPSSIGSNQVSVSVLLDPNGDDTNVGFRYGPANPGSCDGNFTWTRYMGQTSGNSGPTTLTATMTYLTAGATYYYCFNGDNDWGRGNGQVLSVTLPTAAPSVVSLDATDISINGITLNGQANPHGETTAAWFRYSTVDPGTCDDSFGVKVPASGVALGSGTNYVKYSETLTGLPLDTTYYYCAIAQNAKGTSFGWVQTFSTPSVPAVTTDYFSYSTGTEGVLRATVNPRGDAAVGYFRYSTTDPGTCNDTFGTRAPATGGTAMGNGTTDVLLTTTISGLSLGTTYYFCALATNALGTGMGAVKSFKTIDLPVVTTLPPTNVTGTTATFKGSAIANGGYTYGWFRYSDTDPGTCNDSFGTRRPWGTEPWDGAYVSSGYTPTEFSAYVSGLTVGTTLYYCAIAWNAAGYAYGTVESFTVPGAPLVTTSSVSGVTGTTATFEGSVTPRGAETTAWFRFATSAPYSCNDSFGTRWPATGGVSIGAGLQAVAYTVPGAVLTPGTTYHYCAIASNAAGTGYGQVQSFTTPNVPLVTTFAATSVSGSSATLKGSANPRGDATTGWFRFATASPGSCNDSFGMRVPATGGTVLGSGSTAASFEEVASGLTPGTTYYYCAIAQNGVGPAFGSVQSFVTPAPPTVATTSATSIGTTSATLNGTATPHGVPTTGYFRVGTVDPGTCSDNFGSRYPATGGSNVGSGTSATAFSQTVTGLSSATQYYFCAVASNQEGTRFGNVQSFQTAGMPSVTTVSVTAVPGGSIRVEGSAVPNGLSTTGFFRYGTTSPGATCSTTYGSRAPSSGGTSLGSGSAPVSWTQTLTGLTAGTTWYFCAMASNSQGTAAGAPISVLVPTAPTVSTLAASGVSPNAATLNGSADPRGSDTTGWFRYGTTSPGTCNDTFGTRAPASGGSALGSGTGTVSFSETLTGLLPGTTYYVCAIAENVGGLRFGSVVTVTTQGPPVVSTLSATGIGGTSVTVRGSANPNGAEATGWLRYDTTDPGTCDDSFGIRVPATGGTALGSGQAAVTWSESLTGLATGTTYYVCAIASNTHGTSFGTVQSFTTLRPPTVSTVGASSITASSATFAGEATPNGLSTTGWFRYSPVDPGSCDDTFGIRAPSSSGTSLGSGASSVAFTRPVSGLSPGTTYYFCALASNAAGTTFGAAQSFTTSANPPAVSTLAPTALTGSSATLEGTAVPNAAPTQGWFRFATTHPGSCNDVFGTRLPATGGTSLGSGIISVPFAETMTGLTPGSTYYYCAIASNAEGTRFGSVMSFTSPSAPTVTTSVPTNLADTTGTFGGSVNAQGAPTTAWIRIGTTNPGSCNDTFGTRLPDTGGVDIGSGRVLMSFTVSVTGLSPATQYFVCAIAENVVGKSVGEVQRVRTLGAPQVTTGAASLVTDSSARLNGNANPNGAESFGWFRLGTSNPGTCRDNWGMREPSTGSSPLGAGTFSVKYTRDVTNLVPGTRYYYCAVVQNALGTSFGEVKEFQPAALAPVVTTLAPTEVEARTLTLQGKAKPNRTATYAWFRYDTVRPAECDDEFGTRVPENPFKLGSGTTEVPFTVALEGLKPSATIYYCAMAENLGGVASGEVIEVTTASVPPDVRTLSAEVGEDGSVLLHGAGTPHGLEATAWFRYDDVAPNQCDIAFGTQAAPERAALGNGHEEVPFAQSVRNLPPGRYYYCGIIETSAGFAYGTVESFEIPEAQAVGCGCGSGAGGLGGWLALASLLLLRGARRRRGDG